MHLYNSIIFVRVNNGNITHDYFPLYPDLGFHGKSLRRTRERLEVGIAISCALLGRGDEFQGRDWGMRSATLPFGIIPLHLLGQNLTQG